MKRKIVHISFLFLLLVFISYSFVGPKVNTETQVIKPLESAQEKNPSLKLNPDYGNIPLYFIPNEGQVNERALFYAKTSRYTLWMTSEGLVFDSSRKKESNTTEHKGKEKWDSGEKSRQDVQPEEYERDVSRLIFQNANDNPEIVPLELTEHRVNYFIGNDKDKWKTDILTSKSVLYRDLYKNIDLKVYGVEKQIEYDWIVKPGGNPEEIIFAYKDTKGTEINDEGDLLVLTEFGELVHKSPVSYQIVGGDRVDVESSFKRLGEDTYGFEVGAYDKNYELVIDPVVLAYSTYLGGSDYDSSRGIAVDSSGNAYVTGRTESTDFPTQNPYQTVQGIIDAFVTKLSSVGNSLVYSTYLGGDGQDYGFGIFVDSSGNAYVTGSTNSTNFPTQNPYQTYQNYEDVFVTKLSSAGNSIAYSTYLGGDSTDYGLGIVVDSSGSIYVTGDTWSIDFPTQNPYQTVQGRGDGFVTKLSSAGNSLSYSTYLGGSDYDSSRGIVVDSSGNAYVTGYTFSNDFPTQNPFQIHQGYDDAFVTKLSSAGNSLVYSTYLGGGSYDFGTGIAMDSSGNAYITGYTESTDFPTQHPYQTHQGNRDGFVSKFSFEEISTEPIISELNPSSGGIGTKIKISGVNFGSSEGTVTLNGLNSQIITWSDTEIVVTVPTGATTGPVVVQASSGLDSNGITFTVIETLPVTLKWPLNGSLVDRQIILGFGDAWPFGACGGFQKKHVGIDVSALKEENVYAPESGIVRAIVDGGDKWKYSITIEHNISEVFTTVCWHIDPDTSLKVGDRVTKDVKIGEVADLGNNTHFHFGIRKGIYSNISNRGALPKNDCDGDPAFPGNFIDPFAHIYSTSKWPKYMHDNRNTGQSDYSGPKTNNVKWEYILVSDFTSGYFGTPVISKDGTVYIGSGTMSQGNLFAIDEDGNLKWKSQNLGACPSVPAIADDGTVYVGTYDFGNYVYAINPEDGTLKWSIDIGNRVNYITLGDDGTIYFTSETSYLYALNSDGTLKWKYSLGNFSIVHSCPVIDSSGTLYVSKPANNGNTLYAIGSEGSLKWSKFLSGGQHYSSTSLSQNGTIYVSSKNTLFAINSENGDTVWSNSPGLEFKSNVPSITTNGNLVIGSHKKIWIYNASDGSIKYTYNEAEDLDPSLFAIDKNGDIYVAFSTVGNTSGPSKFISINNDGTEKWKYDLRYANSPPALSDNVVYVAGLDNDNNYCLFAFGDLAIPLISSILPNSGSVGTIVTITGENFCASQGSVTFSGTNAGISSWTDTQIVTAVPLGTSTGPVVVQSSDGKQSNSLVFTVLIEEPTIAVTSPNGGESWKRETTQSLTWTQTGLTGNVTIDLYKGGVLDSNVGTAFASNGSFSWDIPSNQVTGDEYKVRIYQDSIEDYSDKYFSITKSKAPIASLEYSPENPLAGNRISFDASNSVDPDGEIVSYLWDFGDGFTVAGESFTAYEYSFFEEKTYSVCLTVTDNEGDFDTFEVNLPIDLYPEHIISPSPNESPKLEYANISAKKRILYYELIKEVLNEEQARLRKEGEDDLNFFIYMKILLSQLNPEMKDENLREIDLIRDLPEDTELVVDILGGIAGAGITFLSGVPAPFIGEGAKLLGFYIGEKMQLKDMSDVIISYPDIGRMEIFIRPSAKMISVHAYLEAPIKKRIFISIPIDFQPNRISWRSFINSAMWAGITRPQELAVREPIPNFEEVQFKIITLHSPGELRVFDSTGECTGMADEGVIEEINDSKYVDGSVVLFSPADSYRYEVKGTDNAFYGINITSIHGGTENYFNGNSIPISTDSIHEYTIDWEALLNEENGVSLTVDYDGDGSIDHTISSGNIIDSPETYRLDLSCSLGGTIIPDIGEHICFKDSLVKITGTPEVGYYFQGWTGNVASGHESDNPISITMDSDKILTASFQIIPPSILLSKNVLNFGATTTGTKTPTQQFLITNSGGETLDWSVSENAVWIDCTSSISTRNGYAYISGTGSAMINVSVDPSSLDTGTYNGTITVSSTNAANSPQTIAVTLTVKELFDCDPPFGSFDTPIDDTSGITGAIPVTGWVLDDIGIESVKIYRDPVSGEQTEDRIYIGDAILVEGARADVEQAYPDYPMNYQAGWGYMILTNFLPDQGNGTYKIHAFATDLDGHTISLGTKTIHCDNANAIKPFGAIDTPTQGGTVTGPFFNAGWALTPMPNSIPTDGSTINVWVDGVRLGNPAYNQYRNDIASLFPGYENTDGAVGAYFLDTTSYTNGVHTIAWSVRDNAGNSDGIGSRFFTIANTGGSAQAGIQSHKENLRPSISFDSILNLPVNFKLVRYRIGYREDVNLSKAKSDEYGKTTLEIREVERIEIELGKGVSTGYIVVGDQLRPLPIGSTLDTEKGVFYWQPGPGFVGEYDVVFIGVDEFGMQRKIQVKVKIISKFGGNPISFFKDPKAKSKSPITNVPKILP